MFFTGKNHGEQGSVLMESVLLLPVVLLSFMAAAQFAHIYLARHMIEYAAYSGARAGRLGSAAVIQTNAYNAAQQICSILSLTAAGASGEPLTLPWLGTIENSQSLADKLQVDCTEDPGKSVTCTVRMDFPLVVPVARDVIAGLIKFTGVGSKTLLALAEHPAPDTVLHTGDKFPHLRFKRSATVPRNYQIAD